MTILDQPFSEIRCHTLDNFGAIALTPWGQKKMNSHPGFNEFLLNRGTEKTKEGKEAKYNVVKTLVDSPTTVDVFGQPYFVRLKVFEREGPFYIQAEAAVAVDGS